MAQIELPSHEPGIEPCGATGHWRVDALIRKRAGVKVTGGADHEGIEPRNIESESADGIVLPVGNNRYCVRASGVSVLSRFRGHVKPDIETTRLPRRSVSPVRWRRAPIYKRRKVRTPAVRRGCRSHPSSCRSPLMRGQRCWWRFEIVASLRRRVGPEGTDTPASGVLGREASGVDGFLGLSYRG